MAWKRIKLEEVLHQRKHFITIDDSIEYKRCRVQVNRKGVVLRDIIKGLAINTKKQQVCKSGDFLVAEIDAKVGGYGFINDELDGAIVSSHYFLFEIQEEKMLPAYFALLIKTDIIQNQINSRGSTNYAAIRPAQFLNFEIMLPSLIEQQVIVNKISALESAYTPFQEEINLQIANLKLLRQSVLQEAIEGKLVSQDTTDEPASALLERIEEKIQKLITKGRLTTAQQPAETEWPFEIPSNWKWSQLSKVGIVNPRNSNTDEDSSAAFTPMQNISSVFNVAPIIQERKWGDIKSGFTHFANDDVGFAKITPCFENSKAAIFQNLPNGIGAGTTELHVVRCLDGIEPGYVYLFFKSVYFLRLGESKMTGSAGQKRVPADFVKSVWFPVPPQKEQQRIVSKVNQLMSLCDEMEQQIIQSKSEAEQLLQTVLKQAFEGKHTVAKQQNKQDEVFWQKQLLASYINMLEKQHKEQGEMAIAKYAYLNDKIYDASSGFRYVQHNFGPYSPEIRDCLTSPDALFYKKTVGTKGYEVYHVNKEVEAGFFGEENQSLQEAQKGFRQLMQVFSVVPMQDRARQLELIASICWLIEQRQSIDLNTLYEGLENWPTPKRQVQHKGQLFTKTETAAGLQLIQQRGWHLKLLHTS